MTRTVLIVEDDLELQELYEAMLETDDYRIVQAADGYEALEKVRQVVPDVIVLDIIFDEMMGDELFRKLKSDPITADTPIVVATVLTAERCREVLGTDSRTAFLRKPFRHRQLLEAIERCLVQPSEHHRGER